MKFSFSRLTIAWLVCATSVTPAAAQDEFPFTHLYDAPIVILYDPQVLLLTDPLINTAIGYDHLARRASEVAGVPVEGVYLTFQTAGADEQAGRIAGNLAIGLAAKDPAAAVQEREVWLALANELENALRSAAQRLTAGREQRWDLMRDLFRQRLQQVEANLEEAQAVAEQLTPIQIVDIPSEIQQLSSKKREAALLLAGAEARRQALQGRIDELQNRGETAELDREIIAQLEQIVGFHEQKMQMLRAAREGASVSELEVQEGEAELVKSRIDLLRAKKESAAQASPELAALGEELSEATIAAAEQRAVLQAIESRMEELNQAAAEQARQMQAAQEAERRAAILREQLATIEKRLAAMELERLERTAASGGTVTIVPWTAPPTED